MAENLTENISKLQKLRKLFLECPICVEEFDEDERKPRLLPCLHGYCNSCLQKCHKDNAVTCSFCKIDHQADSLDIFPVDRTRRDLLDFVRANTNVLNILCENCEENQASSHRCQQCSMFLCGICVDAHNRMKKITGKHSIFSLQENIGTEDSVSRYVHQQYCEEHEEEKLQYYCSGQECGTPICISCYVLKHSDKEQHTVKAIGDVYKDEKKDLEELSMLVQQRMDEAKVVAEVVDQTSFVVKENTKTAKEAIDAAFDSCQKLLERRRKFHQQNVQEKSNQKQEVLEAQSLTLSSYIDCMKTDRAFLAQSLSAENKAGFLFIAPTIKRRLISLLDQELEQKPFQTPHLNFVKQNMISDYSGFVQTLGSIAFSSLFPANSKVHLPEASIVNQKHALGVRLYDHDNNLLADDNVDVQVKVTPPTGNAVNITCSMANGGLYKAEWVPTIEGRHLIQCFAFNGREELYSKEVDVMQPIQQNLTMYMDDDTLHDDWYLSEDRMSLFNRRHPLPEDGRTDGHHYSFDWSAGGHALHRYHGVKGSRSISVPDNVYYEVEIDFNITTDLTGRNLVCEVGLAWEQEIDVSLFVGSKEHGWSVDLVNSGADKHEVIWEYCNNNNVTGDIISSSKSGTTHAVTLGVNVDTPNQAITFVDPVSHKRLYRFNGVDTAQPLWPVFGVYNTEKVDVRVTLRSGDDGHIPVDLLHP